MAGWTYRLGDMTGLKELADDEIRLAAPLQSDSIVDGPGLRAVLWCQGCYRGCPGCHNPESWDLTAGTVVKIDWVKEQLRQFRGQSGLTFSGGEPMLQARACREIADWARRELGWNILSFTGYLYEDLRDGTAGSTPEMWDFVRSVDMLVDGPFILAERDLSLRFRGSRNQRLIHLKDGAITKVE